MIRYFKHSEIDKDKWDKCIDGAFNGMIYANSWYLDLVNENWEALVENDYERVLPLTNRQKFGISYLFQPPFTQQLGVFSQTILTEKIVDNFLDAIPSKYKFIEINFNTLNKISKNKKYTTAWLNHELDLISSYDQIFASYSKNVKRNIKKAEKTKIFIQKNVNPESIINLFRKNKGKYLTNIKDEDYILLKRLIHLLIYKRKASVMGAYTEKNELCAGVFFVFSKNKTIFFFSATDETAKKTGAMPFLIDSFIRENSHSHLTLDFEGSNDPDLARFYKSFGAKEIHYLHYRHNKFPPLIKTGFNLIKKIKKIVIVHS